MGAWITKPISQEDNNNKEIIKNLTEEEIKEIAEKRNLYYQTKFEKNKPSATFINRSITKPDDDTDHAKDWAN